MENTFNTSGDDLKSIHTLNVQAIKESKIPRKKVPEINSKYDKLRYWMLFGLLAVVPFLILGIFYGQFFYLVPLGPILGAISWFVRRFIKNLKLDVTENS